MENENNYNDYNNVNLIEEPVVETENFEEPNTIETDFVTTEELTDNQNTEENVSEYSEAPVESTEISEEVAQNDESYAQYLKVYAKALNIRKEPNKDSDIVTIVYKDEILTLCESESIDGFYKVTTNSGLNGYCMEQFVNLI